MTARVKVGRDNDAPDTPYATVSYGPLLFALGIPDAKDANTPDGTFQWNYALDAPEGKAEASLVVERQPMPARWDWPFESPLRLRAPACRFDWKPLPRESLPAARTASKSDVAGLQIAKVKTLLPAEPVPAGRAPEQITLIPYGWTKFRVSMFPITERARKVFAPEKP